MVFPAVTTRFLCATAVGGAFVTATFGLYAKRNIQVSWAKKKFYQDAVKALRSKIS
jgi:hypothetical protein